jgi:hypothetical protein
VDQIFVQKLFFSSQDGRSSFAKDLKGSQSFAIRKSGQLFRIFERF